MVKIYEAAYAGWQKCLFIENEIVQLVVTLEVGPRIIRYALQNGENMFCEVPDQIGTTGGDSWKMYGGHRLWHAPEIMPRTYINDNFPVKYSVDGNSVTVTPDAEEYSRTQKEMVITLSENSSKVTVEHRITNLNSWDVDLAVWCLTVSLGTGILFAIGLFSSPISWMLNNRLALILAFFFGLVLGSVATVWHKVKNWSIDRYIALILGAVGGFVLVGLPVLATPPEGKWYIVICGAIAISAMILPGISGSFILLLMGKYQYVLDAVNQLKSRVNIAENLLTLLLFGAGIIIGLAAFVRFLSWLLKKYHDVTVALLIGFMLGSLRKVWPWKVADNIANANVMPEINTAFFFALLLAAAGLVLVVAVEYVARKMENNNNGEM